MQILLDLDSNNNIVPSGYALAAKMAGLNIITWTAEHSGLISKDGGGFYYSTIQAAVVGNKGAVFEALYVLDQKIGILGVFSDWPATVTFYATCIKKWNT
jgi:glycerophosphoryl diester phosphodiesterase